VTGFYSTQQVDKIMGLEGGGSASLLVLCNFFAHVSNIDEE
jgi:hypothetical protein